MDVTAGAGGHSLEFLRAIGTTGSLVALDADAKNLTMAESVLGGQQPNVRLRLIHANFRALPECLPPDIRRFDIVFADLGLSSPHLDEPERGFTFRAAAPLDMRFDQSGGPTAADILNSFS